MAKVQAAKAEERRHRRVVQETHGAQAEGDARAARRASSSTLTNIQAGGASATRPGDTATKPLPREEGRAPRWRGPGALPPAVDRQQADHGADAASSASSPSCCSPSRASWCSRTPRRAPRTRPTSRSPRRCSTTRSASPRRPGRRRAACRRRSRRCRTAATSSPTTSPSCRTAASPSAWTCRSAAHNDELKSRLEELAQRWPESANAATAILAAQKDLVALAQNIAQIRVGSEEMATLVAGADRPHDAVGLRARAGAARQPPHVPRRAPGTRLRGDPGLGDHRSGSAVPDRQGHQRPARADQGARDRQRGAGHRRHPRRRDAREARRS